MDGWVSEWLGERGRVGAAAPGVEGGEGWQRGEGARLRWTRPRGLRPLSSPLARLPSSRPLSPPRALSRPSRARWLSSSPSTVHLGRRAQGQGRGSAGRREGEGLGEGARGGGGSEGREMGERRVGPTESASPQARWASQARTHVLTLTYTHTHTHIIHTCTLTMDSPRRERRSSAQVQGKAPIGVPRLALVSLLRSSLAR